MKKPTAIEKAVQKAFATAKRRNWENIFVAVDIHETMVLPTWKDDTLPTKMYNECLEAMRYLSARPDVTLIMFTSSWPAEIERYLRHFADLGINFKYVNENPEVLSKGYGCYDKKFYFNIVVEDKAGFDPMEDWTLLHEEFKQHAILDPVK